MRDDFTDSIRRALALRVSHRCSNPACNAATSGPHTEPHRAIQLGVAAHIAAAASGGPRFDPAQSPTERAAASNGIWLCQLCARLIDTDEARFSVSQLHLWKREAEARALAAAGERAYVVGPSQLEALVIQDGDLPAGFRPAQVRDIPPSMFYGLPPWRLLLYRQLEHEGRGAGGVTIVYFHSPSDLDTGYEVIAEGMRVEDQANGLLYVASRPLPIVGDRALIAAGEVLIPLIRHTLGDIVFTRGDALVHVRLSHAAVEGLIALARRIDARLKTRSRPIPGT